MYKLFLPAIISASLTSFRWLRVFYYYLNCFTYYSFQLFTLPSLCHHFACKVKKWRKWWQSELKNRVFWKIEDTIRCHQLYWWHCLTIRKNSHLPNRIENCTDHILYNGMCKQWKTIKIKKQWKILRPICQLHQL